MNKEEIDDYEKEVKKLNVAKNKKINIFGEKKNLYQKYLDKSIINFLRKKRKVIKKSYNNYFNDYKNLSLILIYCLLKKKLLNEELYHSFQIKNKEEIKIFQKNKMQKYRNSVLIQNLHHSNGQKYKN